MADDGPVLLCEELHLYLRHVAKVTVAVLLPEMKGVSVSISNWEIMEKLKALAAPEVFSLLRVGKTTRQILYFEGELSSLRALRKAIVQLHGKSIKLNGLSQQLRVRAGETELHFPTKKDWEGYFRDRGVPSFEEGLPGDRCDTVCIQGVPTQWMVPPPSSSSSAGGNSSSSSGSGGAGGGAQLPAITSASKVRDKAARHDFIAARLAGSFGKFGAVKRVDVVENAGELTAGSFSSFGPSTAGGGGASSSAGAAGAGVQSTFDGYVQYESYESFCSAMAGLRGMKLARRVKGEPELAVAVAVAFDRASHMSDRSVRRRRKDLDRQLELEQQAADAVRASAAADKLRRDERQLAERRERDAEERRRRDKVAAEALRQREERERRRREHEQRRVEEKRRRHTAREAQRARRAAERRADAERRALEQQRRLESERLLAQVLLMAAAQRRVDAQRRREEEERQERARSDEARRRERLAQEAARQAEAQLVLRQRDDIIRQIKSMEDRHLELQRCLLKRKLASERALLQAAQAAKK